MKPKPAPAVNPSTGGTRLMYKNLPVGPIANPNLRQGPLPITPYSSGKLPITSMQLAGRLTLHAGIARLSNEAGKDLVAANFDAMFKNLHAINQQRRVEGLPEYTPSVIDVYAPYASSKEDYANAENRILNDLALSTAAQEAARRGTPMNGAELSMLSLAAPLSYAQRLRMLNDPEFYKNYMGSMIPVTITPDEMGRLANGIK